MNATYYTLSLQAWDVYVHVLRLTKIFSAFREKTDSHAGLLPSSQSGSSSWRIEDSNKEDSNQKSQIKGNEVLHIGFRP